MHSSAPTAALAAVLAAAGCQTYAPAPVDVAAHVRAFAARQPDDVASFADSLRARSPRVPVFDLRDGLTLDEARLVALVFHPDLRLARRRAGVAEAGAREAGRWDDPALTFDLARILESVDHRWIVAGALSLTVPITGRPGLERALAGSEHSAALVEARAAEATVLAELDTAWARWSAAVLRAGLVRELLARLAELEEVAVRLATAGEIARPAARVFTLERLAREAETVRADGAVAVGELAVRELLGLSPAAAVELVPALAIPERVADAALRRDRVGDGPRVAPSVARHEVAERALELAVREQWPDLTLLPGYEDESGQPRATLGFSLPLPFWNRNARAIAEARAARELAAEEVRTSIERALLALARAETRLDVARRERAFVERRLVPLAEQQVDDGRRLAELGQLDTLLILDSLLRANAAKTTTLDAALAESESVAAVNALFWPDLDTDDSPEAPR
ncbi:MAG: TolC family protein [Planctomycetes bacterium]|nr:TolC family protein [Planctomycetota bacterium]